MILKNTCGFRFIERVQHIAQREARALLGAKCEVLFFDATTLYFEVNNSDELRKNGWSKDGKSQHVQVVLALVQTVEGLPIGGCVSQACCCIITPKYYSHMEYKI